MTLRSRVVRPVADIVGSVLSRLAAVVIGFVPPGSELLFDLTFATSFGLAASGVASALAKGDFIAGPLWRHSRAVEGQRQRIHHAAA
jgi:hypothetical protein